MKHLAYRLIGGFCIILFGAIAMATMADIIGEQAVHKAIESEQEALARHILEGMNQVLSSKVDQILLFRERPAVMALLETSNSEYRLNRNAETETSAINREWTTSFATSPSAQRILDTPISRTMSREFIDFYTRETGLTAFSEMTILDAQGRVVGITDEIRQYDWSDEPWWNQVKNGQFVVEDFELRPETNRLGIPVSVPILSEDGTFKGAMHGVVSAETLFLFATSSYTGRASNRIKVVQTTGNLVYSSQPYRPFEDISNTELFKKLTDGSARGEDNGRFDLNEGANSYHYTFILAERSGFQFQLPIALLVGDNKDEVFASLFLLRRSIVIGATIFVILGIVMALLISRSVTQPVSELTTAAMRIAEGDLNASIRTKGRDEISTLARAFTGMKDALSATIETAELIAGGNLVVPIEPRSDDDRLGIALRDMQANLRSQIRQIAEASELLLESGNQISALSSQLAASTSESASAVGETTSTVEEVKQTALLSNEKAQDVSKTAQETVSASKRGEASVGKSLDLLQRIRTQMGEVGGSILNLSEKNQTIGDIIMSVGELSDQSNLLAVNASIEAARAGEHGQGFTVVAQEIRNLAEQSKKATERVRDLLGDIQKATNAAVLSMEQGAKSMDEGLEQSSESGEVIKVLADQIERSAEAATQIAASSRQQLAGMDQVVMAMESIKDSSEQNATSTQSLGEEVLNLTEVGTKLMETVRYYKTE